MNFIATISSLAIILTSAINALIVIEPTLGSSYSTGLPLNVEVINSAGETFETAEITIASASGNLAINVPVGNVQSIVLPCNIVGETTVVARAANAVSNIVLIMVNPAANNYPYANDGVGLGCGVPCANPCGSGSISYPRPPRASCRSRRGCGHYAEAAESVSEFKL